MGAYTTPMDHDVPKREEEEGRAGELVKHETRFGASTTIYCFCGSGQVNYMMTGRDQSFGGFF